MRFNHFVREENKELKISRRHLATIATEFIDENTVAYGIAIVSPTEVNPTPKTARNIATSRCEQALKKRVEIEWGTGVKNAADAHAIMFSCVECGLNKLGVMNIEEFKKRVKHLRAIKWLM